MKRNILAVVIPALLAAGAANAAEIYNKDGNKLDVYGKVDGLHYFSDNKGDDGDKSYVRFGFKGETQITDQLAGYGQWEYNVQADKAESQGTEGTKTRLGFAGLKFADFGSFDYGRNYGVIYDVEAWTDMLPEFGGDSYTAHDNFMNGRANGVATYRNSDFFGLVDGLDFALQYQGKNENGRSDIKKQNGDGWGISATYDLGWGITAGAAYSGADRTDKQAADGKGNNAETWTTGLKYDANNVYLAAMYAESRNTIFVGDYSSSTGVINGEGFVNKTQSWEVVAQYQFDFGLRPSIAYLQSKGKNLNGGSYGDSQDIVKYVDVGATYYFNKNMSTYVDYKINLLDDNDFTKANGISTDDIVALGLVYQF